jgi:shikimate kinase
MDGYYDPMLTPVPGRPVAICGFIGSGVEETAFSVCRLSGLTLVDIERRMEHELGRSLRHHVEVYGDKGLGDLEHRLIHKGLRESPPPIIALRPYCMMDGRNLRMLERHSTLFYIERSIFLLFARILDLLEQNPQTRFLDFRGCNPKDITSISRLLMEQEPGYRLSEHRLKAMDRHPRDLAREILEIVSKQ